MAVIRSTDLDFDQIKANLKTFLEQQDEFADYDFEASGLSNILDVLAYNTHVNGLIANLGINEAFLSSAQLRSSVVSHADTLGYFARSKTGASATLNLSINTSNTTTTTVTIPKYTEFTTSIDDVSAFIIFLPIGPTRSKDQAMPIRCHSFALSEACSVCD